MKDSKNNKLEALVRFLGITSKEEHLRELDFEWIDLDDYSMEAKIMFFVKNIKQGRYKYNDAILSQYEVSLEETEKLRKRLTSKDKQYSEIMTRNPLPLACLLMNKQYIDYASNDLSFSHEVLIANFDALLLVKNTLELNGITSEKQLQVLSTLCMVPLFNGIDKTAKAVEIAFAIKTPDVLMKALKQDEAAMLYTLGAYEHSAAIELHKFHIKEDLSYLGYSDGYIKASCAKWARLVRDRAIDIAISSTYFGEKNKNVLWDGVVYCLRNLDKHDSITNFTYDMLIRQLITTLDKSTLNELIKDKVKKLSPEDILCKTPKEQPNYFQEPKDLLAKLDYISRSKERYNQDLLCYLLTNHPSLSLNAMMEVNKLMKDDSKWERRIEDFLDIYSMYTMALKQIEDECEEIAEKYPKRKQGLERYVGNANRGLNKLLLKERIDRMSNGNAVTSVDQARKEISDVFDTIFRSSLDRRMLAWSGHDFPYYSLGGHDFDDNMFELLHNKVDVLEDMLEQFYFKKNTPKHKKYTEYTLSSDVVITLWMAKVCDNCFTVGGLQELLKDVAPIANENHVEAIIEKVYLTPGQSERVVNFYKNEFYKHDPVLSMLSSEDVENLYKAIPSAKHGGINLIKNTLVENSKKPNPKKDSPDNKPQSHSKK